MISGDLNMEEKEHYLVAIEVEKDMYDIIAQIKEDIRDKKIKMKSWHVFFESAILSFLKMAENEITPGMFDRFIECYKRTKADIEA